MEIYEHNSVHLQTERQKEPRRGGRVFTWVIIALLAACIVLSVVAIALLAANKSEKKNDFAAAYDSVKDSVVEVYGDGGTAGSGVIYKIRGGKTYVMTNFHVVGAYETAKVRFTEFGDKITGKVLGYDEYHDISLVEVDGNFGKKSVESSKSPQVGEDVLAVGNSLGYGMAAFDGIISKADRMLKYKDKAVPVYAVTAPINEGMSGGGLFMLDGKIAGINTYKSNYIGGDDKVPVDGMSYCVPFVIADSIAKQILQNPAGGQIPMLGVTGNVNIEDEIIFGDLYFSAVFKESRLEVNAIMYASEPAELRGGVPMVGDTVKKIGALEIDYDTGFIAVFAECLKYLHEPSFGTQPLEVVLERDGKKIVLSYDFKQLKPY